MTGFLKGLKMLIFGLVVAVGPAALNFLSGVDWSATLGITPSTSAIIGVVIMALRTITTGPIALPFFNSNKINASTVVTLGAIVLAGLLLSGCASTPVGRAIAKTDNALAQLSQNQIPKACNIVNVAEGYFDNVKDKVSPLARKRASQASAAVGAICSNPPTNTMQAILSLYSAWTAIQDATTVPK